MKYTLEEKNIFEFIMKLDGNIICQRYFNVKSYDGDIDYSSLDNSLKLIANEIIDDLTLKNMKYPRNPRIQDTNETYSLEVLKDNEVCGVVYFPAGHYYRKVRYNVNIKPKVREFIKNIMEVLSPEN